MYKLSTKVESDCVGVRVFCDRSFHSYDDKISFMLMDAMGCTDTIGLTCKKCQHVEELEVSFLRDHFKYWSSHQTVNQGLGFNDAGEIELFDEDTQPTIEWEDLFGRKRKDSKSENSCFFHEWVPLFSSVCCKKCGIDKRDFEKEKK